jgi:hypothetical protein
MFLEQLYRTPHDGGEKVTDCDCGCVHVCLCAYM